MFNKEKWLPLARDVPVLISGLCCNKTKKEPIHAYYRNQSGIMPFLAMLAEESRMRTQAWIRHGCNAFDSKHPTSNPLSFWTEQDILRYIVDNNIEIASVYGDIVAVDSFGNEYDPHGTLIDCKLKCTGCQRTGCIYCALALHLEKGMTRFQRLAITHPKQYEYSIGGGQWVDNPAYDPTAPKFDGEWQNWNPKKIWVPSKKGLGMGKVFDMVNEVYGKSFYRYE
jgi:3'-phosphoadenosine 5'-phosphosulfate sulfotransferase (PAPS reductase)/FAD synthetase